MKKHLLLIALFLSFGFSWAQKDNQREINYDFHEQMQVIFGKLEKDRIPNGILLEYAFPFADLKSYNGSLTDSTAINLDVFSNIYKTLMMGRIHAKTEADFLTMEDMTSRWAKYRKDMNSQIQEQSTVVLSGLLYNYSSLPEKSFELKKIQRDANTLKDLYVNGVWQNPYEVRETVAITPPISEFNTRDLKVMLPKELFLSNSKGRKVSILADFSDGNGFVPVPFDSILPIKYTIDGKYDWIFKIDKNNGEQPLFVKTPILIDKGESSQATTVFIPNGIHSAVLSIAHAPGHGKKIKKPFIVVEGFDPGSILHPEKIGGDRSINHFLRSVNESYDLFNLLKGSNQEYDIIYVDWTNGVGDIRENAKTLVKVLDWVNEQKRLNASTESNVVIGQSMGGLVSRFALVRMEKEFKNHDVRLFIAHDSPFQGANTPVSAQVLSRHALKIYLSNPVATTVMEMVVPFIQNFGQLFDSDFMAGYVTPYESLTIQDSPAALQMTKYFVKHNFEISSSIQNAFQQEMDALGYPIQSRNIAISNGNLCGIDNGYAGGAPLLVFDKTYRDRDLLKQFLYRLGANIWAVTTGDIALGVITLIPGTAKITCLFDLRSIPEQSASDRTVYSGRISYTVLVFDILGWRPSVTTSIVPLKKVNISNQFYPLETFAGGINSMKSAAGQIDDIISLPSDVFKNPIYSFIPVTSGLDLKRNSGASLSVEDNRKGYSRKEDLVNSAFNSPFANFITEIKLNDVINFNHISFSARNGSWLANELNRNVTQIEDCSFICNSDKQGIIGSDLICQSEVYRAGFTANRYQWEIIQGGNLVSIQNATSKNVTLNRIGNNTKGLVVLQLKLSSDACGEGVFRKEIWVGAPGVTVELDHNPQVWTSKGINISSSYNMDLFKITNVEWIVDYKHGIGTGFTNFGYRGFASGSGASDSWGVGVTIKVHNKCGTTVLKASVGGNRRDMGNQIPPRYPKIMSTQNLNEYEVFNVVEDEYGKISYEKLNNGDKVEIYLHSSEGKLVKTINSTIIDINDLPQGVYVLNAFVNDKDHAELRVYKK